MFEISQSATLRCDGRVLALLEGPEDETSDLAWLGSTFAVCRGFAYRARIGFEAGASHSGTCAASWPFSSFLGVSSGHPSHVPATVLPPRLRVRLLLLLLPAPQDLSPFWEACPVAVAPTKERLQVCTWCLCVCLWCLLCLRVCLSSTMCPSLL